MTRITFANSGESHNFCVGDLVSGAGSEIVVAVDHEHSEIRTARATWLRRLWYWARGQVKSGWWWLRCTWGALWVTGEDS